MRLTEGRKRDTIQLPDGRMTPGFSVSCLNHVKGIKQFQIIQEKLGYFIVKIVKDSQFTNSTIEDIKGALKHILGDVEIDIVIVDTVPRERSGKFRPFITKVPVS